MGRIKGSGKGEKMAIDAGSNRYAKYLSGSVTATSADMETFTLYMCGRIDIDECFEQWWLNNRPKLVRSEFAAWLRSMGYDPVDFILHRYEDEDDDEYED